jgi:hypothetical protein
MYRRLPRIKPRHIKLMSLSALYMFCLISIHSSFLQENDQNFVENLQNIRHGKFSNPAEVKPPSSNFINIGTIIINLQKTEKLDDKFKASLEKTFNSIFKFSSGTPLHFIIVTDKPSICSVSLALGDIISKDLTTHAVLDQSWRWRRRKGLPTIKVSFVDIDNILVNNIDLVNALKKYNINGEDATKEKYAADLFYIAPLYHLAFQSMDKLIFIDSSDLVFVSDVQDLQGQFVNIVDEAVMEVGLDLSPHYRSNLDNFIETDLDTHLGKPGRFQGLNTGVVLFDLEKMRNSVEYNNLLTADAVNKLFKTFQMKMTVGDQDWFTLLSFQNPHLFSILPCQFNTQTSLQYWSDNKATFNSYHDCDVPGNIKIFHCNGCGPKPEHCGSPHARVAEYREHINLFIQVITLENFWAFLGQIQDFDGEDISY